MKSKALSLVFSVLACCYKDRCVSFSGCVMFHHNEHKKDANMYRFYTEVSTNDKQSMKKLTVLSQKSN